MGKTISTRMDSTRQLAESNRILLQTEAEGKQDVESLLKALGHERVVVTFNDDGQRDQQVIVYQQSMKKELIIPSPRTDTAILKASAIPFGFLPLDY